MNRETAAGISGWTVPMLRLVSQHPTVAEFLSVITTMILNGTCPGANILCGARLTGLYKKEGMGLAGGLRPIAVGELLYRVAMKAIVERLVDRDMLPRSMFGVKSPGGVEPIVRLLERAMKGDLEVDYKYCTSMDFRNAFNNTPRGMMPDALKKHAKGLFRCARWGYGSRSRLVITGAPASAPTLWSSEGVRQGDPLGPVLFSLTYRPVLDRLRSYLGEDFLIVSYLDDTYILSPTIDPLPKVIEFFSLPGNCLTLNPQKCKTVEMDTVRKEGFEVLGSIVGPLEARRAFLNKKVDSQIRKLSSLSTINANDAGFAIFRKCFQQDLRHLQRSLDSTGLEDIWDRLDAAYLQIIHTMRASEGLGNFEAELVSLPVREGGLGVLSHRECSVYARTAANQNSDWIIAELFDEKMGRDLRPREGKVLSQGKLCKAAFSKRRQELMKRMSKEERALHAEASSKLGRAWQNGLPLTPSSRFTDHQLSSALAHVTLARPLLPCKFCGHPPTIGHGEVCCGAGRGQWTINRHNHVVKAIETAHKSDKLTKVFTEPATTDQASRRRNDLLVYGSSRLGNATTEHDVKVYSLLGAKVPDTRGKMRDGKHTAAPKDTDSESTKTLIQLNRYLDGVAREARSRAPGSRGKFSALVFSAGGIVEAETMKQLEDWRKAWGERVWRKMWMDISFGLVKVRAETWGG